MPGVVRCPSCCLVLEVPSGAAAFRCPCGLILEAPPGMGPAALLPRTPSQQQMQQTVQQMGQQAQQQAQQQAAQRPYNQPPMPLLATSSSREVSALHADQAAMVQAMQLSVEGGVPEETADESRQDCEVCHSGFSMVLRRKHHCRNCGALVCGSCSEGRWPASMLPASFNRRAERLVRVCTRCAGSMERFRGALLAGDTLGAQREFSHGHVRLTCPYTIYPNACYPLHCAASSGNVALVQWLIAKGCLPKVRDGRGFTACAAAAQKGHLALVQHLLRQGQATVDEITDRYALQQCLLTAVTELDRRDAPGAGAGAGAGSSRQAAAATTGLPPPPYAPPLPQRDQPSFAPRDAKEEEEHMRAALAASRAMFSAVGFGSEQAAAMEREQSISKTSFETPAEASKRLARVPPPPLPAPAPAAPATALQHQRHALDAEASTGDECLICFDAQVQTCFVPCGHSCCCAKCAEQFKQSSCPVCRRDVDQIIRTFKISM